MSERIHSPEPATNPTKSRRRFVPIFTGTAILLVAAGVGIQFLRANPAASQTAAADAGANTLASTANSAKVLAKVNGQSINYDVVARECVNRYGQEVLDTMINRLIIQQECERRNVTVSMQEVEEEVAKTAKKFNLPVDTWYKMLQSERKLTRVQYQQDVIWPMIALKKLAGQDVVVSEEDMRIGFERDYGPRVNARLILVDGNIRQASQIWERCQATPDEFDRIAREFSADPNTRPLGGVIPPIRKHGGSPQIEEQAFRMKVGEISPVIQVQESRYVILKCEGFTEPVVTEIKDVWDDLYAQLVDEKTQKAVAKVFEDVRDQSRVDNFLTNQSTGRQTIQPTSGTAPASGTAKPAAPASSADRAKSVIR
ncbi:peptidylprolyl isomerase [Planctomicrobium sp. SH527]|uniref:peptidylprolyl isomerase n=1 Tax=Planctomicrobium sp. SH527 TaxID=3448123 RepID=UPI003F5C2E28